MRLKQLEREKEERELQRQKLYQEKERIRNERKKVLITQIGLLVEGKKDLQRNLLNTRDEQMNAGEESDKVRKSRREELQRTYKEYAYKIVDPILEYWDIDDHTLDNVCILPVDGLEEYEVTYKVGHVLTERELMNLLFNMEEIKLEPMYWKTAQQIRAALLPQQELETRRLYQQVKQDWDQKYATAEQW